MENSSATDRLPRARSKAALSPPASSNAATSMSPLIPSEQSMYSELMLNLSPGKALPGALPTRYSIWLIRDAWYAAPNPLSMLTTDTPFAQLLSMASSAATPPRLAP